MNAVRPYALQLGVLVSLWIFFVATTPSFAGVGALYAVLQSFALLGLVAVGMAVTVVCGELDISVASVAVLAGVICVRVADLGLVSAILVATLTGTLLGVLQGGLIAKLMINSLVFTIGSQIALRGVAYVLAGDGPAQLADLSVSDPMLQTWAFLAPDTVVALVVVALVGFMLAFTRPGRELYAVGGGRAEATAAGVSVTRSLVLAFAVCGACAALAGAMASMKSGGVSPDSHLNLMLTAPAAILVGGFSLTGGRGNVLNVVLGVGILSVLTTGLGARGVQAYTVDLFVGALLLVVVVGGFLVDKDRDRRVRRGRAPSPTMLIQKG